MFATPVYLAATGTNEVATLYLDVEYVVTDSDEAGLDHGTDD